ncbi:M20 metallopeptidase family protein [Bacillus massiliigorillae]|uniref:M20 metallopeptidase family protein n=1 Tax=Bacillus massiliigorillae TaxID=1243664 RepID=UPI0003A06C4A|nr:amidohydrolase [Bacillus massiliigorillae]
MKKILYRLEELYPEMVELRRHFHQHPELSFQEVHTPQKISDYLNNLGIEVKTNFGGNGVVGYIRGGKPGKTVALRADFDALPIQDEKGVPYKSTVPGVMHACGHDAHTTILLAIAKVLSEVKHELKGNVVLIHQFGEEVSPGGAKPMIEAGCLDGVDAIFGTHMWSGVSTGEIYCRSGAMMAGGGVFDLEIIGSGGHGSNPHETIDPITIGTSIVGQLQQIVSRRIDPLQPAVLSVTTFHAGQGYDVIPHSASISGSVRVYDNAVLDSIITHMEKIIAATCEGANAAYKFQFKKGYPPLINHDTETKLLIENAIPIVGKENVKLMQPVMAGEDFAYYLQEVPGTFFFTGSGNEEHGLIVPSHHPKFDIDERSMVIGAKVLLATALTYLNNH